jgi:hypothetical protein
MIKDVDYIVIMELPIEQQVSFNHWLVGQIVPHILAEGENNHRCAYKSDYEIWLKHYLWG